MGQTGMVNEAIPEAWEGCKTVGQILALLSAIFMGFGNVCARKGMDEGKIDRFSGLFITLTVNNVLNFSFLIITLFRSGGIALNVEGLVYNTVAGISNSFVGRWTLFASIASIGAARAGILKVVTPLFAILGGVFLLREGVTAQAWLGIFVVLSGVVYVALETSASGERLRVGPLAKRRFFPARGIMLGLLASFCFAGGNICRKLGVSYIPSPLWSVTVGSLAAWASAGIVLLAWGKGPEMVAALQKMNPYYLCAGLFTSLALYSLFGSLEMIPISIASSIGATEALFTILASRILAGAQEMLSWRVVAGALVVIGGVVILITM
jgi:drug/metabolite transporter (DMT)-like permease